MAKSTLHSVGISVWDRETETSQFTQVYGNNALSLIKGVRGDKNESLSTNVANVVMTQKTNPETGAPVFKDKEGKVADSIANISFTKKENGEFIKSEEKARYLVRVLDVGFKALSANGKEFDVSSKVFREKDFKGDTVIKNLDQMKALMNNINDAGSIFLKTELIEKKDEEKGTSYSYMKITESAPAAITPEEQAQLDIRKAKFEANMSGIEQMAATASGSDLENATKALKGAKTDVGLKQG